LPETKPLFEKEQATGQMIAEILTRYPQHKRVLVLKVKYDNNDLFTAADLADLKRFHSLIK
jgi:hypothetical protein